MGITLPCENRWAIFTAHLKINKTLQGDYDTMTTLCTPIMKVWATTHIWRIALAHFKRLFWGRNQATVLFFNGFSLHISLESRRHMHRGNCQSFLFFHICRALFWFWWSVHHPSSRTRQFLILLNLSQWSHLSIIGWFKSTSMIQL